MNNIYARDPFLLFDHYDEGDLAFKIELNNSTVMATKKLKYNARVSLDRFYNLFKGLGIIILITSR